VQELGHSFEAEDLWEIIVTITAVTLIRVGWIAKRPLPHDVQPAIMGGLQRLRQVLKREVKVVGYAPYGIIWYAMNLPLGRLLGYDGRKWMILLALMDSIFLWISQRMGILGFSAYLVIGTFMLFRAPWNVTIDWIVILSLFYWWFLLVAPIAKLPVGLPLHAFGDTGRGLFYQHNYIYYGLLGTLWLIVLFEIYVPSIFGASVSILGIFWSLLLGFLYLRRLARFPPSSRR